MKDASDAVVEALITAPGGVVADTKMALLGGVIRVRLRADLVARSYGLAS